MTPKPDLACPARPRPRPFKLTRYFSITSLVGIAVITACLIGLDGAHERSSLVDHESRANADLTRAFANTVWGRYRHFVLDSSGRSREALLADPVLSQLRADVLAKMSGLRIAKIKIYNRDGLTVFSTDERQVGEDKRSNQGFRDALAGNVNSQITYRDRFDAFEGVLNKRNLIASYIPVRSAPQAEPEGVFEVYSDVTELLAAQRRAQYEVFGAVVGMLALLYLFLLGVARKADRIICRQEEERSAQEEEVRHQAYHDPLTALPNRASFAERLRESVATAARHGHCSALMFIDLDRFKVVNDSLGHDAGDALLKVVSRRIQGCLRGGDLLFRIGGDEFTAILPQLGGAEDAAAVARRIIDSVIAPVTVDGHELAVGATVGIALYPGDGDTAEALLRNADAAMYTAKNSGRGTHAFYRPSMSRRALQRLELEAALHKGFRAGEFALWYQPRVDAATHRVVALEALLRWVSPTRGVVLPAEFIGLLEDTGLMMLVGEWALRSACTQVRRWQDEGLRPLRVSVNVSSLQFQSADFARTVERVLCETRVDPALIELELTESLLIAQPEQTRTTMAALKALGVRLAIDDFGTGYSSLNYLRHFAVDYLKVDRSFVSEIATDARARAVATAISELAKALDITVVAEGVECEAQARFFAGIHCGELQGFLFSAAVPPEELRPLMAAAPPARPSPGVPAAQERLLEAG